MSLDLGLRYEVLTSPTEKHGRFSNLPLQEVNPPFARVLGTSPAGGKKIWPTNYRAGFGPRIGLAWDPRGQGKTSLRAGFGVFYDQIDQEYRFYSRNNPPFRAPASIEGRPDLFPNPWHAIDLGTATLSGRGPIDPNIDVPTVMHVNLGLEQQVGKAGVLKVGYVGASGYHLLNVHEVNIRVPRLVDGELFRPSAAAPFAQPRLGRGWSMLMSEANSRYHALQTEFETRFADSGLLRQLRSKFAHTFSKSVDDISSLQVSAARDSRSTPMHQFDIKRERGLSAHHNSHLFTFNFTYDFQALPLHGVAGALLNHWQWSGIGTFASGMPLNVVTGFNRSRSGHGAAVDRPNMIPGGNNNLVVGRPGRYFDPSQFALPPAGFLGNLGANTVTGPGLATLDFSLVRNFPVSAVSEQFNVQFRAEFFNIFNRANFGRPDLVVFTSAGAVRGAAGRITDTATPNRQIQLGLRIGF
ncbi:MAG: hypothetical protein HY652_11260 [Acidobacteria bacterium]|nr:hypothetical protein [Acidobacteriota bacterium]